MEALQKINFCWPLNAEHSAKSPDLSGVAEKMKAGEKFSSISKVAKAVPHSSELTLSYTGLSNPLFKYLII